MKTISFIMVIVLAVFLLGCQSDTDQPASIITPSDQTLAKGSPYPEECETAFALGDITFIDLGLTVNKWGWVISADLEAGVDFVTPIYASANKNDIAKGFEAGLLTLSWDGQSVTVRYEFFEGFTPVEIHVYLADVLPTVVTPSQYGFVDHPTTDGPYEYIFEEADGEFYLIAHAVLCPPVL